MSERSTAGRPAREREDERERNESAGGDDRRLKRQPPGERGGPKGPEPTRFGDWEKNGRCFDF